VGVTWKISHVPVVKAFKMFEMIFDLQSINRTPD
jgi:hypothetical protein